MRSTAGQAGFTLFEILVAVTVMAIAFGGLYAGYASMVDIAGRVQHTAVMEEMARLVMDQTTRDLRGIFIPTGTAAQGQSGERFSLKYDDKNPEKLLEFTTRSSLTFDPAPPGIRANRVSYGLTKDLHADLYTLRRREQPHASVVGPWPVSELELCSMVKSFSLVMEEPKQAYSGLGKAKYLFRLAMTISFQGEDREYTWSVASKAGSPL